LVERGVDETNSCGREVASSKEQLVRKKVPELFSVVNYVKLVLIVGQMDCKRSNVSYVVSGWLCWLDGTVAKPNFS
ncbi:hypothetical protein PC117_g19780, partial [Phytophthora cactorum]